MRPILQRVLKGVQGIHRIICSLFFFDIVACRVKQFTRTRHKCRFRCNSVWNFVGVQLKEPSPVMLQPTLPVS